MLIDSEGIKIELKVFSFLLFLEQITGEKLFVLFRPFKELFLNYFLHIIEDYPIANESQVIEFDSVNPDQFNRELINLSRPLIFKSVAKDWNCCKKWDLEHFKIKHGENDVLIVDAEGLTSKQATKNFEILSLSDLVENIKAGGDKYLRFSPLLENNPQLAKDLDLDWLKKMQGKNNLGSTYYMFLGGKDQKTLLHSDQPCNLYVQVYGRKKWTFFSPRDSIFLYPNIIKTAYVQSELDLDKIDNEIYPLFKYATKFEIILNPGDVLYVPPHYWHQVENLDDSIAVGYRFSSIKVALKSSMIFSLLRILSMNPPIWKTMKYGKVDTNLIWAHTSGILDEVLSELKKRKVNKN